MVLWLLFAFATWNVVFDRQVALDAARFARANVERYQQGELPITIDAGYRPGVGRRALDASLWGAAVLAIGLVACRRRTRRGPLGRPRRPARSAESLKNLLNAP